MNSVNIQVRPVALVTGGARRIGAAIVKMLHQKGYCVVIHCRHSLSEANELARELNAQANHTALVVQQDLTEPDAGQTILLQVIQWSGRLDVLVNNASEFIKTDLSAFDIGHFDALYQANVRAPLLLSVAARALLAKNQGVIVNITDIHAQKALKHYSAYCQTKAALEMQTLSLAREFAPEIRVNAVAPGAIAWPEHGNRLTQEVKDQILSQTPLKKHGKPEYIAQAVYSLVENPFITGQILQVDGGRSL